MSVDEAHRAPATVATAPGRPATRFRCADCGHPLVPDPVLPEQLGCAHPQCSAAGLPVTVWRAQRARVRRGEDVAAPGAGWPRPVFGGRPHPWLTPVSDGVPWWTLLDGARQVLAQDAWLCQLCGDPLQTSALVALRGTKALSDTALHPRCLTLAVAVCPHLATSGSNYTAAAVTRADLLADGRPLPPPRPDAAEDDGHLWTPAWTVRATIAAQATPLDPARRLSRPELTA